MNYKLEVVKVNEKKGLTNNCKGKGYIVSSRNSAGRDLWNGSRKRRWETRNNQYLEGDRISTRGKPQDANKELQMSKSMKFENLNI